MGKTHNITTLSRNKGLHQLMKINVLHLSSIAIQFSVSQLQHHQK